MARVSQAITASETDIKTLRRLAYGADSVLSLRARIILKCLEGGNNKDVAAELSVDQRSVALWKERFRQDGIEGLSRKHGGGRASAIHDTELLDKKIFALVSKTDNWTINSISVQLGVTEHAVKSSLSRQGIKRRRQHKWITVTEDEIIAKAVDIRGIYLTEGVKALAVASCDQTVPSSGEFTTRNRVLAMELLSSEKALSLADILVTARRHSDDAAVGKPDTFSSFVSAVISGLPPEGRSECHFFVQGNEKISINGGTRNDIHFKRYEACGEWFSQVKGWIAGTYDTSIYGRLGDLFLSMEQYIGSLKENTEPFFWIKQAQGEASAISGAQAQEAAGLWKDQVDSSVDRLMSKMQKSEGTQVGALIVVKGAGDVSVGEIASQLPVPDPFESLADTDSGIGVKVGNAEAAILSFTRELELQMLKMYMDSIKKNRED